jgi:hypothetical protein
MCAQVLPLCLMLTFFVITVFIMQVGSKNGSFRKKKLSDGTILWISAVVAGGAGLICLFLVMPFLRKRIVAWEADNQR